ncbi:hypothetical protein X777_06703 [Ooceraea biroi]|uniref:Uncharacterized protein n=1 Tax=Ooceraea biroi TaxID=2015173 RepID=A0A026WFN0_OOCBI|nr:hypothetical protein X777_06703 [Ooceraea biroi]
MDVSRSEENWQNRVQELLWEKLKVQCRVGYIRKSGQVLIVKIESEEEKQDILANKNRLKGDRIFVEHDLTWEERKRQEEIKKWAIEQRYKGKEIKIGFGKVRVEGKWIWWEEMIGKSEEGEEGKKKEGRERKREGEELGLRGKKMG